VIEIWNNRSQQELEPIFEEWLIILDWCVNTGGEYCDGSNCIEQNINTRFDWAGHAQIVWNII
jgi:hypothetical protein